VNENIKGAEVMKRLLPFCAFPESLLWRRIADLHVLISSTFGAILGWKLCKEGITDIFQQEEGR